MLKKLEVNRAKSLVRWDVNLTGSMDTKVEPSVSVTFSYERAKTQMGDKQGAHVGAHALNVMRAMKIVSDFTPVERDNFVGITKLANEIERVQQQDKFLLEEFRNDTLKLRQLETLKEDVALQRDIAISKIDALSRVIAAADGYKNLPANNIQANGQGAQTILDNLQTTNTDMLKSLKLDVRRNYCMSVITKAATGLLEYQNTAPYASFETIPPKDDQEKAFNKREGRRVRDALAALKPYSSTKIEVLVDVEEEEETELGNIVAVSSASAVESGLRRSQRSASSAASVKIAVASKLEAKEVKELSTTEIIVSAIYNLLYYPPVDDVYSQKAIKEKSPNKRTNDVYALGFVITRHLVTVFATFDGLEKHNNKEIIVNGFIDKMLNDWRNVIKQQEDVLKLKKDILGAFDAWANMLNDAGSFKRQKQDLNLSLGFSPDQSELSPRIGRGSPDLEERFGLQTFLEINSLEQVAIQGDGHCLYRAVGLYLGIDVQTLRNEVASYIGENRAVLEPQILALIGPLGIDIDYYISNIKNKEWADNLEIGVLEMVYRRPIIIIGPDGAQRNISDNIQGEPIYVLYNGHNHYDGLVKTEIKPVIFSGLSPSIRNQQSAHSFSDENQGIDEAKSMLELQKYKADNKSNPSYCTAMERVVMKSLGYELDGQIEDGAINIELSWRKKRAAIEIDEGLIKAELKVTMLANLSFADDVPAARLEELYKQYLQIIGKEPQATSAFRGQGHKLNSG